MTVSDGSSDKQIVVYKTFTEFYPFYLSEHINPINRFLHFTGTTIAFFMLLYIFYTGSWYLIPYAFAWVGHFFFEKNKPATFKYPVFSFIGDWKMWSDILRGKQPLFPDGKK